MLSLGQMLITETQTTTLPVGGVGGGGGAGVNASTGLKHMLVSGVIEVVAGTVAIHAAAALSLHKRKCISEGPGQ